VSGVGRGVAVARRARHIEEAIGATPLRLGTHELDYIDHIVAGAMPFAGPCSRDMPTR
jgi:hypothetical protein